MLTWSHNHIPSPRSRRVPPNTELNGQRDDVACNGTLMKQYDEPDILPLERASGAPVYHEDISSPSLCVCEQLANDRNKRSFQPGGLKMPINTHLAEQPKWQNSRLHALWRLRHLE